MKINNNSGFINIAKFKKWKEYLYKKILLKDEIKN